MIAIGTHMRQLNPVWDLLCLPNSFIESLDAAVKGIGPIILRNLICLAILAELAASDSVAIPPNERAEEWRVVQISIKGIEPQRHVG